MNKPRASQPLHPALLTSRDKYENSFWMERLPAHVWIQDEENSVIYSNRLSAAQLDPVAGKCCRKKKISCFRTFMGEIKTCPCCPYKRLADTMQPESCVCRKGGETHHVYHYPIRPYGSSDLDRPIHVLKLEINVGAIVPRREMSNNSLNTRESGTVGQGSAPDMIRICSACKKIWDESGGWREMESYFGTSLGLQFSHGLCSECACQLYPDIWPGCTLG